MRITKDMTISNIINKYPQTATIMLKYGLHCISCHIAASESVEHGAMAHGLSNKEFDKMLREMNKVIGN